MQYIDIIIAAVSGGTLAQVFTYLIKRQEVKTDDFETIVAQWKEDNKRLREENEEHERRQNELYRRIAELEKKISQLNTKLLIMESSYMHIPLPSWLKDIDGTMLALNDSYEKEFLLPCGLNRTDYIGKTDYAVWSEEIAKKFIDNNFHLCVAESCTGGLLAKKITDESGSSAWFDCGLITYSNESKIRLLGVKKESLTECGAVSQEVAQEMAIGAQKNSRTVFSISITGIAGPNGGSPEKPVGTIFICFAFKEKVLKDYKLELSGDRSSIREQTVNFIIDELDKLTFNGQI